MTRKEHEKKVLHQMISHYCHKHHGGKNLCADCSRLLEYSLSRVDICPKGDHKTSCRKCPTHCYSALMRQQIRVVMKYVGPRMIFIHPVSAIRHLINESR